MVEVSPTLSPSPAGGVLRNVQVLRALAAFMVVFVHLEAFGLRLGGGPEVFVAGNAGVDLFFVISGFIMVFTTLTRPTTPAGFMGQRIQRIVPLYWLITLAVFAIALAAPSLMQATRADPVELLKSLTFIPFTKSNGLTQPVAFVGWTLNYEMAFYALFALGLLAPRRWMGVAATAAAIVAVVALGAVFKPQGTLGAFYTAPIMLEFAYGMGLGLLWLKAPLKAPVLGRVAALAILPLFILMIAAPQLWPGLDRAFAFGLPATGIVFCALALERAGLSVRSRLALKLGDASYAVYLTHFFVTQAAVKASTALSLTSPAMTVLLIIVTLAAVALVGVAVHHLVERPIAQLLRRRTRRPALKAEPCASA